MRRILLGVAAVVVVVVIAAFVALRGAPGGDEPTRSERTASSLGSRTIAYTCALRICVGNGELDKRPRALTPKTPGGTSTPAWSPDGSRLAYLRSSPQPREAARDPSVLRRIDLYVMDADGSDSQKVASRLAVSPLAYAPPFAWSPDGRRIAVSLEVPEPRRIGTPSARELFDATLTGPSSDLYVVDAGTRRTRRLTRSSGFEMLPAWVSSRLVYARLRRGDPKFRSDVRVVAGGRDRSLLRASGTVNALTAAPDGRRVAVVNGGAAGPGLVALDVRSARSTVLLRRCCVSGVAWSPDGRRLAVSGLDGPLLYLLDAETKRLRPTAGRLPCLSQDWSPDGRTLICDRPYGAGDGTRRGGSDLILVDPATGRRATLTTTARASGARWKPLPAS